MFGLVVVFTSDSLDTFVYFSPHFVCMHPIHGVVLQLNWCCEMRYVWPRSRPECTRVPKCAQVYRSAPECTRVYPRVPESTRVHPWCARPRMLNMKSTLCQQLWCFWTISTLKCPRMINMEYKILHSTLQVHGTSITRIKKSNKMKIHQSALAWDEIKLRWHYYAKPVMIWEPRFTDEKPEAITNFARPTNSPTPSLSLLLSS